MKKIMLNLLCAFVPSKKLRHKIRGCFHSSSHDYLNDNNFILIKQDGTQVRNPSLENVDITFKGKDSTLIIHEPFSCNCFNMILGNNNFVEIKANAHIGKLSVPYKLSDYSELHIGENFSAVSCDIYLHDEPHNSVVIGDDCLFSFGIVIWPSDGHTIFDASTKEVLNEPKSGIEIGNHVWIGRNVTVLKESVIPDNSVVGCCSVVNKKFSEQGCVYAGIPAKVAKKNINWSAKGTHSFKEEFL